LRKQCILGFFYICTVDEKEKSWKRKRVEVPFKDGLDDWGLRGYP
jgi:hypothetical protein